ncbi:hypothetical protein L7F22_060996 [Adiantum nelumboides]|nr:hypothetical protein [Adiantum nelumboides]
MAAPVTIRVDAWSDLACPWCYVGKARLDKAIQKLKADAVHQQTQVEVHWHPYMIDVNTRSSGEEYLAYNKRRWGSDGWTSSLRSEAGWGFSFYAILVDDSLSGQAIGLAG